MPPRLPNPLSAELVAQWHPVLNGTLSPSDVSGGSKRSVWWLGACGHEWEAIITSRSHGSGCPVCAGKRLLAGFNDFGTRHPDIAKEWHPTLNGDVTPEQLMSSASTTVWWLCSTCDHSWGTKLVARVHGNSGCPACAGTSLVVGRNDLSTKRPDLVPYWAVSNGCSPSAVSALSRQEATWACPEGHEWVEPVRVTASRAKEPCLECRALVRQQKVMDVKPRRPKNPTVAEAFPHLVAEWSEQNTDQPDQVTTGSARQVIWECVAGHTWLTPVYQRARLDGSGCPSCVVPVSAGQQQVGEFLQSLGFGVLMDDRVTLPGCEIDVFLPEEKFGVEFNGLRWHGENYAGRGRGYHTGKHAQAVAAEVRLVQVWADQWENQTAIVKRLLAHQLGATRQLGVVFPEFLHHTVPVQGRKTQVQEVPQPVANAFLEENHLQGAVSGGFRYGLFQGERLVALLVAKREAGTEGRTLNILRYATACPVPGGFGKLLKHLERTHSPEKVITFSDHLISDGNLYAHMGFTADKVIRPDYQYVVGKRRVHKFNYRLKRFRDDPNLLWEEGLSESELARLNNLDRVWDAGKTRWVKKYATLSVDE